MSGAGDGMRHPAPLRMTKWFDTNYHFLVPELEPEADFSWPRREPLDECFSRRTPSAFTRGRLLGPVCWPCWVTRVTRSRARRREHSARGRAPRAGLLQCCSVWSRPVADWVQIDEPILALDLPPACCGSSRWPTSAWSAVPAAADPPGGLLRRAGPNLEPAMHLPISALHLDLVRAPEELAAAVGQAPGGRCRSLPGRGRRAERVAHGLERCLEHGGDCLSAAWPERVPGRAVVLAAPLPHFDLSANERLDPELCEWLASVVRSSPRWPPSARAVCQGRAGRR